MIFFEFAPIFEKWEPVPLVISNQSTCRSIINNLFTLLLVVIDNTKRLIKHLKNELDFFCALRCNSFEKKSKRADAGGKKYEYLYESNFLFSISTDINKNLILIAQLLVYPQQTHDNTGAMSFQRRYEVFSKSNSASS